MLACLACVGVDSAPVTEESMSSKKVYPAHVWRQFQLPNWTHLLRVTPESFTIVCKYIVAQHMEKPSSIRSKLSKQQVEEASQLAAMTSTIASILAAE